MDIFLCAFEHVLYNLLCVLADAGRVVHYTRNVVCNCLSHRVEALPTRLAASSADASKSTSSLITPNKQYAKLYDETRTQLSLSSLNKTYQKKFCEMTISLSFRNVWLP